MDILDYTEKSKACNIILNNKYYICGISFVLMESSIFCGHRIKHVQTANISSLTDKIKIAVNTLGVQSIKYSSSLWLGYPSITHSWQGLSLRETYQKI